MLDGLLGRTSFKTKCKSAIARTKTRIEVIKRKRNGMQKFLKKDIADHLKNNLDRNAYGRAEGLYVELNLSSCYDYIANCCTSISQHLKEMHNQSECPEECRVAVASLIYAAARFSDLPELAELRNQFCDKYSKDLESFVDHEFVEKLKAKPPTMEIKLQLMQDIAVEFSVRWDPEPLQQELQCPSLVSLGYSKNYKSSNGASDDYKIIRTRSDVQVKKKKFGGDKMRHSESSNAISDKIPEQHKNKHEHRISISFSSNNDSEDTTEIASTLYMVTNKPDKDENLRLTLKEKSNNFEMGNDEHNEGLVARKPRSVRTKLLKQSHTTISNSHHDNDVVKETLSARAPRQLEHENDVKETLSARAPREARYENNSSRTSSTSSGDDSNGGHAMLALPLPPVRRRYFFPESSVHTKVEGNMKSELPMLLQSM